MTLAAFSVDLTIIDPNLRKLLARWSYNSNDPIVIGLAIGSKTFIFARTILVEAFERAPRPCGEGVVQFVVRNEETMQVAIFPPDLQRFLRQLRRFYLSQKLLSIQFRYVSQDTVFLSSAESVPGYTATSRHAAAGRWTAAISVSDTLRSVPVRD
jgi:hypothetical protein